MIRGFEGTTCVLCGTSSSTRQGEHVWPQWYLEDHPPGAGPYPWSKNGEPLPRRDGTPIIEPNLTRVRLPVCRECNGKLDRRFEKPGKPLMRQLFWGSSLPSLNAGEVEAVALWLLKTWLLLSRPDVEYASPRIHQAAESFLWPELAQPQFYEWLVTGAPPPEGLSLWLHQTDDLDGPVKGGGHRLLLPTVHEEGRTVRFEAHEVSLQGLTVALVVHPGWPIQHPLEASEQAVRLWPDPPAGFDFGALPSVPRSDRVLWSRGLDVDLVPGALGSGRLPPLSAGNMPFFTLLETGLVTRAGMVGSS